MVSGSSLCLKGHYKKDFQRRSLAFIDLRVCGLLGRHFGTSFYLIVKGWGVLSRTITILSFIHGHSHSHHKNSSVAAICIFLFRSVVVCGFPVFGLETDQCDVWYNLGHCVCM